MNDKVFERFIYKKKKKNTTPVREYEKTATQDNEKPTSLGLKSCDFI